MTTTPPPGQGLALRRINDDSAWIVEIDGTRIVLDPWLGGRAVVGVAALSWARLDRPVLPRAEIPDPDAIVVSHPFPDHLHRDSLRSFARTTPAFGAAAVAPWLKVIGGFDRVTTIGNATRGAPPTRVGNVDASWCRAVGLFDTTHNGLVFRGARSGVTVLYCPHGMLLGDATMAAVERCVGGRLDALLCSFTRLELPWWLGGVANLGRDRGIALARHLDPRVVLNTHDGTKTDGGLVGAVSRFEYCPDADAALAEVGLPGRSAATPVGARWVYDGTVLAG